MQLDAGEPLIPHVLPTAQKDCSNSADIDNG